MRQRRMIPVEPTAVKSRGAVPEVTMALDPATQRKVEQIYECIDSGNYKGSLKL